MSRRVIWLQLLIGWLPLWALFTLMIAGAHGSGIAAAAFIALRMIACACALGLAVHRLTQRYPWPRPMRITFVIVHLGYALAYAIALIILNSLVESLFHLRLAISLGPSVPSFVATGVWLYIMIAGVSYTTLATEAAARAEGDAAKSQLAALRSQLHPHFLFNALHAVVQLIPREPARAAGAAQELASLLRTTIEEDRDVVTLAEECAFVDRYLGLERMRFGDRLQVEMAITREAQRCLVPVFALQALVENAVRHGAAPSMEATRIVVRGEVKALHLHVEVSDDGAGVRRPEQTGTGLKRLHERLLALFGAEAQLSTRPGSPKGFSALMTLPVRTDET